MIPAPLPAPEQDYSATRLTRVRAILDTLDDRLVRLAEKGEPRLLRDLAAAADALSDQECWLAGRPRPGIRKPTRGGAFPMTTVQTDLDPDPIPQDPGAGGVMPQAVSA